MNRRNTRKSDSFDFLRIQPKKKSTIIQQHPNFHQVDSLAYHFQRKQRKFFQLPKIVLGARPHRQILYEHSKLLMKGSRVKNQHDQYRDFTIHLQDSPHHAQNNSSLWVRRRRSSKQNYHSRDTLIYAILKSHLLSQIYFAKRNKIKAFVQDGNNSRLIKELLRKRPCIKLVTNKSEANIVWTRFMDWEYYANSTHLTKYIQHSPTKHSQCESTQQENQQPKDTIKQVQLPKLEITELKIHNHFQHHYQISDKKCLFNNLKIYCKKIKIDENSLIPLTYHITSIKDIENGKIEKKLPEEIGTNGEMWMIKPGEDSNRGNDIKIVVGRNAIIEAVKNLEEKNKSAIVQKYIEPLLYKNRKFDIRCYVLVTSLCGILRAYWYREGYIRTCSKQYTNDPNNLFCHLTNDAIQKNGKQYGKYQQSNKLSFSDMQGYFKSLKQPNISMYNVMERMKELAIHSIRSVENKLKTQSNILCFEVFGYDFLIDKHGKVWLIEVNTNPCLQFTGSLTSRVIWHMMENSMRLALDPIIGGNDPQSNLAKEEHDFIFDENKYESMMI